MLSQKILDSPNKKGTRRPILCINAWKYVEKKCFKKNNNIYIQSS